LQSADSKNNVFIIKTKVPAFETSKDFFNDLLIRLHVQVIKRVLKKASMGCGLISEQREAELLGKKSYLIMASYDDGSSKYQVKNYLLKHDGKIYGVGYKVKEDVDVLKTMTEVNKIINTILFIQP